MQTRNDDLQQRAADAARRVRARAVWSLALFAAAFPATLIGAQAVDNPTVLAGATLLATVFWGSGAVFGIASAVGTLRKWDILPQTARWLGVIPVFGVGLIALVGVISAIATV